MENNDNHDGNYVGHQTEPCTATIIPSGNIIMIMRIILNNDDNKFETMMIMIEMSGTRPSPALQLLFYWVTIFINMSMSMMMDDRKL